MCGEACLTLEQYGILLPVYQVPTVSQFMGLMHKTILQERIEFIGATSTVLETRY